MNKDEMFVRQFLSGVMNCESFLQEYQRQPGLQKCLDTLYTDGVKRGGRERLNPPLDTPEKYMDWIGKCANIFFRRAQLYDFVYGLFVGAGKEQIKYSKYEEDYLFALDAVPEYAGGIQRRIILRQLYFLQSQKNILFIRELPYVEKK